MQEKVAGLEAEKKKWARERLQLEHQISKLKTEREDVISEIQLFNQQDKVGEIFRFLFT